MKPVPLNYWTAGQKRKNMGDFITEYLFTRFGVPYQAFDTSSWPMGVHGSEVFRGACTIQQDCAGIFWGTGYSGPETIARRGQWLACRGPVTRRFLDLPASTVLCDPAMLLPMFIPKVVSRKGVLYIPHCNQAETFFGNPQDGGRIVKGVTGSRPDAFASPWIYGIGGFELLVNRIAASQLVLSSSLHACIIAQAYGVQWQAVMLPGEQYNLPGKWADLWAIRDGQQDPAGLLKCFPYPIQRIS